ncbi:hypothetical protein [Burkholderia plantarii]|uniref:hypothetical protein n=1 Tax=Burkholderia plantarii TaxID=41899 RepID=UPI00114CD67E|nr:hypothetical protein [Burkholderia plantarii]
MRKTWVIIYPAGYSFDAPPHAFRMCPGGPAAQAGSGRKAGAVGPRRRSPALPVGLATRRHAAIIRYAAAGIEEIVAPISSIPAGSLPIAPTCDPHSRMPIILACQPVEKITVRLHPDLPDF